MKNRVMTSPRTMRTMFCFMRAPSGRRSRVRGAVPRRGSSLQEELHLDARQLDDVVILERMRRGADRLAVHHPRICALDVCDEVALRAARQHRHLHAGLAERGERLGELELLAGV